MLDLLGVEKNFGPSGIRSTDLHIARGRTTVLIGPSGCGKSTLLRLMLGLFRPDRGAICFDGMEVNPATVPMLRRRMGYVIQDGGLFPHLSARDNVTLMARHRRWDRSRMAERVRELARLVRLPEEALGRFPLELSGGQRQRVALMRALMLDPDALFLDEPMGALDPLIRAEVQADLRQVFRSLGKTVVLVTHDIRTCAGRRTCGSACPASSSSAPTAGPAARATACRRRRSRAWSTTSPTASLSPTPPKSGVRSKSCPERST